jgi:SPP1 family predicted phage head-tail adaptor
MDGYKPIKIGELIHRIEIQQNQGGQGADGQQIDSWQTVLRCYAKVEDLTGSERWTDMTIRSIASHLITVRWCRLLSTATARLRAVYQGRNYNFVNINDIDNRHQKLEIAALREE